MPGLQPAPSPAELDELSSSFRGRLYPHDHQDFHGILLSGDDGQSRTVTVVSNLSEPATLYMSFNTHDGHPCRFGRGGDYSPQDFPGFTVSPDNCYLLYRTIEPNVPVVIQLNKPNDLIDFGISVNALPQTGCSSTLAEFDLHDFWEFNSSYHDGYDISLVNGFNVGMTMQTPYGETIDVKTDTGHSQAAGVFGLGWTNCTISCNAPDCGSVWAGKEAGEAHPCDPNDPYAADNTCEHPCAPPANMRCQIDHVQSDQHATDGFTLTIWPVT